MPMPLPQVGQKEASVFERKAIKSFEREVQEIYLSDDRPWVLGYSGGKDSTATLQLIWYAIAALPPERRQKRVFVIASDTFVETPVIVDHISENLGAVNCEAKIQGMPFEAHKVVPQLKDTFWVNLLGRGYPAPSTKFRWCTDRMKIQPANRFILDRVTEFGEVVMVLGARRGESGSRDQVLRAHEIKGSRLRRHTSLPNAFVFAPIEEFTTEDVWLYLLQVKSPWGMDNTRLVGMYKNAQAGECPLVVDTSTPSCGNSRFGCWVCTVVQQDHSMEAMIDNGEEWMEPLLDFRDLLASTQDPALKHKIRDMKRRDGRVWVKENGATIPGPYRLEFCRELLRKLLEAQKNVRQDGPDANATLISDDELHEIRRLWRTERQDWEDSVPRVFRDVMGEDLDWICDDVAGFSAKDDCLLKEIAQKHGVPAGLIAKLLDHERDMQGMSRRAGIYDKIEAVFREDWPEEEAIRAFHDGPEANDEDDD
jgi:DNA sulfur modification protein DndC